MLPGKEYDWAEQVNDTNTKSWSRQMFGREVVVHGLDSLDGYGRIMVNVTIATTLSIPDLRDRITKAWQGTRFKVPMIAARPTRMFSLVYTVPDEEELASWTRNSLVFHSDKEDMMTFAQDASGEKFPAVEGDPAMVLHVFKGSDGTHDLYIQSVHVLTDAIGITMILKELLTRIAMPESNLQWGEEISRLGVNTIVAKGGFEPDYPHGQKEGFEKYLSDVEKYTPGYGFPPSTPEAAKAKAGRTFKSRLTLSKDETSKIVNGARKHGVTIGTASMAALYLSILKAKPPTEQEYNTRNLTCFPVPSNLRHCFTPEHRDTFYNMALSLVIAHAPMSLARNADVKALVSIASEYKKCLDEWISWPYLADSILSWMQNTDKFFSPEMAHDPYFSSIGKMSEKDLPSTYGDGILTVTDWSLWVLMKQPVPFFHIWTYQDQLNLQWCYGEAYFDHDKNIEMLEDAAMYLRMLL